MEDQKQNSITKPCMTAEDFAQLRFAQVSENVYLSKVFMKTPTMSGMKEVVHTQCFKLYDIHPELGTNVEYYFNDKLGMSAYCTDKADFYKAFNIK